MTTIVEELESDLETQDLAQLLALPESDADGPLATESARLDFCQIHPDATM